MGYKIYIPLYTQEGYHVDLKITEELMERDKALRKLFDSDPLISEEYIRIEGEDDETSD